MVTGRKPKSRALKLLHGSQPRRTWNTNEPEHPPIDPTCPAELTDSNAIDEWNRVIFTLAHGHLTTVDRPTMIAYCLKYGQWLRLEAEAAQHPAIMKGINGGPVSNPVLTLAGRTLVLMLRAAAELGATPASRPRVSVAPPSPSTDDSEFGRMQRRRRPPK